MWSEYDAGRKLGQSIKYSIKTTVGFQNNLLAPIANFNISMCCPWQTSSMLGKIAIILYKPMATMTFI